MGACQGPHEVGTLSLVPTPTGVEVLSIVLYAFLQSSVCIFAIGKKWIIMMSFETRTDGTIHPKGGRAII